MRWNLAYQTSRFHPTYSSGCAAKVWSGGTITGEIPK